MKNYIVAIVVLVWALSMTAGSSGAVEAGSPAAQAEEHIRKACQAVWPATNARQIEHCVKRAMGALVDENELRDNQLKRLLMDSERELERCREKVAEPKATARKN